MPKPPPVELPKAPAFELPKAPPPVELPKPPPVELPKAPAATVTPEQQKAIDARHEMELAKVEAEKLAKPVNQQHMNFAHITERNAQLEFDKKSWAKAESLFRDARNFYNSAAGKK